MGHSRIMGEQLEFEVRDSICEAILEKLLEKINDEKLNILVIKVVSEWYDHWYSMPPGCKDLKFTCLNLEIRKSIKNALEALIRELPSNGELMRVAKQIELIVTEI